MAVNRSLADHQTYWVEQLAEGLNFPSSMAWLPNGDLLITERMGGLRVLRDGKLDPYPVSGMPASFQSGTADGVKDILIDPDYSANQTLYLLISEGTIDERHATVYRARYGVGGLTDLRRIFRSKDGIGGYIRVIASRMIFLGDKTLLIAVAEDSNERAQKLDSDLGKIVRINRDGSVPADNPFLNTPGAIAHIWSYGHRVPLGFYHDPATGLILEVESGPQGGDELNLLKAGHNYGWPKASWGFRYNNGGLIGPLQSGLGIENPILIWTPSVTPSGLTRYSGQVYPQWDGDYFVGHLTTKELERLRIEGRRVVIQERMLLDLDERIRDVKAGPDNHLYVLTDHPNGRLLRLQPGRPSVNQLARVAYKLEQAWVPINMDAGDPVRGRQAFLEHCAGCHSMGTEVQAGRIGPDLVGVYGAAMGRKAGYDYSPSLASSQRKWDAISLDQFLFNPGSFMPGTKMAAPPMIDAQMRSHIIGFLKQQSASERYER